MVNNFTKDIIPANETLRLKALEYFDIMSDLPDRYFSNLAQIIAHTFNAEIALISLVGEEAVHFIRVTMEWMALKCRTGDQFMFFGYS